MACLRKKRERMLPVFRRCAVGWWIDAASEGGWRRNVRITGRYRNCMVAQYRPQMHLDFPKTAQQSPNPVAKDVRNICVILRMLILETCSDTHGLRQLQ